MLSEQSLLWLALMTFVIVLVIAGWALISTRRRHKHGPDVSGLGSRNDPMVGRPPNELKH